MGARGLTGMLTWWLCRLNTAVEDFDFPFGGPLDFLAEVEGGLSGVDADCDIDEGLAIPGHVVALGSPGPP